MRDTGESSFRLKPLQVPGLARPIDLVDGKLTMGRAETNDVHLPGDVFPSVSQHHVTLTMLEDELWVEDLGSRNGTLVNGDKIDRKKLSPGDTIQLGAIGPRFVVVGTSPLSETMFVPEAAAGKPGLTDTAVGDIKEALGVPVDVGIAEYVHLRARKTQITIASAVIVALSALVYWGLQQRDQTQDEARTAITEVRERYESQIESLREENARLNDSMLGMQSNISAREQQLVSVRNQIDQERIRLEQDQRDLKVRLAKLEQSGDASSNQIANLEAALDEAKASLDLLDPVNLEKTRLSDVKRVSDTIVLLEAQTLFRNTETDRVLHIAELDGSEVPNFEDIGEPWTIDSTGSGFCVSKEGWIITNAHVVTPDSETNMLGDTIVPFIQLSVVFSGESQRHPAKVVKVEDTFGHDLALVKIEPFEGMPYLEDFTLDAPLPDPGSDVFLFGFPLGNFALQQGSTVIASTFRGILSRVVDNRMQVDAGVHPGNSGGPVTDPHGKVIGIVFSVQATPDQDAVYTIGYAIPVAEASLVWPPPDDWE